MELFIGCLADTRNCSILSLALSANSFRATEENLVFETVQSGPFSSFECFLCSLKKFTFIFYLLSLQLVLCCVAVLKSSPYIVHSAV